MRVFIALLYLVSSINLFGQDQIKGHLIDADTQEGLAYVNIGVIGKNVGTVSNMDGDFDLEIDSKYDGDILRLSMIGYESIEFVVAEFKKKMLDKKVIALQSQITDLDEVVISSTEFKKEKVLGNKTTSKSMKGGFSTDILGNEVGIVIKIKKSPSYIKNFNVSIVNNDYGEVKFRLNFYDLKNGLPDKPLLNENIIITTDIKEGILSVDLTEYGIIVEDDFFVSLEWIEDYGEDGLYFSVGLFGSALIARETSQGYWGKIAPISIGFNVTAKY